MACSGDDSGGGSPTAPSSTAPPVTLTITAGGVEPTVVDIAPGGRVRFVNNDSRVRSIFSTPHGPHTDCPGINDVGDLAPGASRTTAALTTVRICGFHDHQDPDNQAFRGLIRVGTTEGPAPDY